MVKGSRLAVRIHVEDNLRYGSFKILDITGKVPLQIMTSLNLEHANDADHPNFNFNTNILEITEMDPSRLDNEAYQNKRIGEIKQIIKDHPDKLCFLGIKGLKSNFRINKERNEFLIQFQIDCGFKLIHVYFKNIKNAKDDLIYFRNSVQSKKKYFVACVDEKLPTTTFESLYSNCLESKDEIISFFGRRPNSENIDNFNFIKTRINDNILRFSLSISKSNQDMANSIMYNVLGFDCFSFSRRIPTDIGFGGLVALNGLYFDTLTKDTELVCVLTGENLYDSTQRFKKHQNSEYLPIYIHDMVRLNQLLKELHVIYTNKELVKLFGYRLF